MGVGAAKRERVDPCLLHRVQVPSNPQEFRNVTGREIIVGDVHGMLHALEALLGLLAIRPADHVVFLGDLINKGPDSRSVVSLVRALRDHGHDIVLLMGNHEERLLRYYRRRTDGHAPEVANQPRLDDLLASLTADDLQFLQSAQLWHRLPRSRALAVHGGVPPNIGSLPHPDEIPALTHRQQMHAQQLLRVRQVNADGNMIRLEHAGPEDRFWAEVYDGRFGHVYFGHHAFAEDEHPRCFTHATGMDLGAVYGNRLAAAILEPGSDPVFVTVPAPRAYATWNRF